MKFRLSKRGLSYLLFKVSNFDLVESARRFNADPIAEASAVLEKAEATRPPDFSKHLDISIKNRCIFMPAYRRDGVGIQALVRICVMFLARQAGTTYCHLPFLELQHQFNDPLGFSVSRLEWANKWESFLNLGQDEYSVADLSKQVGLQSFARKMADEHCQFGRPGVRDRLDLSRLLAEFSVGNVPVQDVSVFNLRFFRDARASRLAFDSAFVSSLQAKFATNGYVPQEYLYSNQYCDIAIHVRRGDIWESYQAGDLRWEEKVRFMSEDYYVDLLQRLRVLYASSSKPIRFHIFSDGQASDFSQFTFLNEREAYLDLGSGERIENIQFHLSQNALDALYHLAKAPVLIPAKSSFSFLAVLLGTSQVLYDEAICEFYQYDFLKGYMQKNARFTLLSEQKIPVDCFA